MRPFLFLLLWSGLAVAAPTSINVEDSSGAPVKDVLVILKDLNHEYRDISRQLTDEQGRIHSVDLKQGVYRAIAAAPYGLWQTAIKEFLVNGNAVEVRLVVDPKPTHGFGDIVTVGPSSKAELQILKADGTPAAGAEVLVRDKDATLYLERWYKVDHNGKTKIDLVAAPTVIVVIHETKLITTTLASTEKRVTVRLPAE